MQMTRDFVITASLKEEIYTLCMIGGEQAL